MTREEAEKVIGRTTPRLLRVTQAALALHPWNNTPEEARRLEAANVLLRHAKKRTAKRDAQPLPEGGLFDETTRNQLELI